MGILNLTQPGHTRLTDQRDLVEAVAVFTENLRDTVVASSGLEQAITSTLDTCPRAIEPAVRRLVADLRYGSLDDALRRFADDLAHPACDFVVAALLSSVQNTTRDLAGLLSQLSKSAREECNVYLRVWVSRARTRSAVRIVAVSLFVFVVALLLLDHQYLAPYASPAGASVLVLVAGGFLCGLGLMDRMARVSPTARLIRGRVDVP